MIISPELKMSGHGFGRFFRWTWLLADMYTRQSCNSVMCGYVL